MSEPDSFELSQGLNVLRPRSGNAYPIPCNEWKLLKEKIEKLKSEPWLFHTIGSILIGSSISTLIAIIVGSYSKPEQEKAFITAIAVVLVSGISGILCLFFANEMRKNHKENAKNIISQMDLIEARFIPPTS